MDESSRYIESCKKLYGALMAITLIIAYFAYAAADRRSYENQLAFLDQVLALRHVLLSDLDQSRALRVVDLTEISSIANGDQIEEQFDLRVEDAQRRLKNAEAPNEENSSELNLTQTTFTEDIIRGATFLNSVPVRLGSGRCKLGLFTGESAQKAFISVNDFMVEDFAVQVDVDEIYLANFGYRCGYRWDRYRDLLSALLFPRLGEKGVIGIENRYSEMMPQFHPDGPFSDLYVSKFDFHEDWYSTIPIHLRKYVYWDDTYVLISVTAIEAWVLRLATERTGNFFGAEQFDEAVSRVFVGVDAREAQVFGVTLASDLVMNLAPLAVFLITFLLVRRTKRLVGRGVVSGVPWVLTDTSDRIGRTFSLIYAISPLLVVLFVYMAFAQVREMGLILGNYAIGISDNFLPEIFISLWHGPVNKWGLAILGIFAVNIALAIFLVRRLISISKVSRASNA